MRKASEARVAQMLAQAYGPHVPGSPARRQRQQAEREWMERAERARIARALWERVHPEQAAILAEMREALANLRVVVAAQEHQ